MKFLSIAKKLTVAVVATLTAVSVVPAQRMAPSAPHQVFSASENFIVPQARVFAMSGKASQVQIVDVKVGIAIVEQVATTTMDVNIGNSANSAEEAELLIPVPDNAVVRSFVLEGSGSEASTRLLTKEEATATYQAIVRKLKDPGLLEFAEYNLVRSSVFPVPAKGAQRIRLTYEHVLPKDGDRVDFVLPRSESFDATTPCQIHVSIKSKRPVATVFSPTHEVTTVRRSPNHVEVEVASTPVIAPGPLRFSYLVENKGLAASILAYPDPTIGGGYFLLFAAVPRASKAGAATLRREVTVVLDRSGSMQGEKFVQAQQAAIQVLDGLEQGESFNIVDYSDTIASFAARAVVKDSATISSARDYVNRLSPGGGTNLCDALVEALRPKPVEGFLPIVLFLTDGRATVGTTQEIAIRNAVKQANVHNRRVFTFGVGYDVNAPLLTAIATNTRAVGTFVTPMENVETKVSQTFRRLAGPVLASPRLEGLDESGAVTSRTVRELMPTALPDLFDGDQLVLLGQYIGDKPLKFRLEGDTPDGHKSYAFTFGLDSATTRNAFVPRLWASRKIARLVDAITQAGADVSTQLPQAQMKELTDEIVRLSMKFGVLTEYTAFLAVEGTDLSSREAVQAKAAENLVTHAQNERSGIGAVSGAENNDFRGSQVALNRNNAFYDSNMNRVETTNVQQIQDLTFYRRGGGWIEASLVEREKTIQPDRIVEFGTDEFDRLVEQLTAEGRQGILALAGEILLVVDGKVVKVRR